MANYSYDVGTSANDTAYVVIDSTSSNDTTIAYNVKTSASMDADDLQVLTPWYYEPRFPKGLDEIIEEIKSWRAKMEGFGKYPRNLFKRYTGKPYKQTRRKHLYRRYIPK